MLPSLACQNPTPMAAAKPRIPKTIARISDVLSALPPSKATSPGVEENVVAGREDTGFDGVGVDAVQI